jgi:putative peptidoglycan lipid II flippase
MYRKLFKNCGTISAGLIVSRVSGLLKIMIVAAIFGTADSMDAFLLAIALPVAAVTVFGDGIYVATVKLMSRHKGGNSEMAGGWREVSALGNFSVLAMMILASLYWIFAPQIMRLIAPGFSEDKFTQAWTLARCVAPIIVLGAVQNVLRGILHANDRFAMPSLKILLSNIPTLIAVMTLTGEFGIASFAVGTVLGEFLVCLAWYIAASRVGARYSFSWAGGSRGIRESVRLGIPIIVGVGTLQIITITDRAFAAGLPAGSISALGYAMLLLAVPLSLVRTVVDVGFPAITAIVHKRAAGRNDELKRAVRACVKLLVAVAAPAAMMMLLWRKPVITLLLARGKFDAAAVEATASALLFYSIALVPTVVRHFLTRLSQSFGDSLAPLPSNLAFAASNIALNFLLVPMLGHSAIALSLALSATAGVCMLYLQLRRKIPVLAECGIETETLKALTAAAMMAVAFVVSRMLLDSVIGAGCIAVAAYPPALVAVRIVSIRRVLQLRTLLHAPSG